MKRDLKGLLCIWIVAALLCSCFVSGAVLAETVGICLYPESITESTEVDLNDLYYLDIEVDSETQLKEQDSVKDQLAIPQDKTIAGWKLWGTQSGATGFVMLIDPETKAADWIFSSEDAINYPAFPEGDGRIISPILQMLHIHDWSYELAETVSENDTINAVCAGEECDADNTTLTITRPTMTRVGEGDASATLSADSLAGLDTLPEIYYEGTGRTELDATTEAPTTAGTYRASITVEDKTAYVEYTIAANTPSPSSGRSNGARYYVVSFETNGGSKVDSQNIKRNALVEKPEDPIKEGFVFGGWYEDKALVELYDFETSVQNMFTLYAKWEEQEEPKEDVIPFSDVTEDDWFYEDILFILEKELIDGISDEKFGPNIGVTRATLVTALYRAEGEPEVEITYTFEDVPDTASYKEAIAWGQKNGIIFGYSETEFRPEQTIIREQIAAIINRYAAYKKYDLSVAENINIFAYEDAEEISEYAVPSVQYVVGAGVMKGKTEKAFHPKDDTTRAELSAILKRFFEINA